MTVRSYSYIFGMFLIILLIGGGVVFFAGSQDQSQNQAKTSGHLPNIQLEKVSITSLDLDQYDHSGVLEALIRSCQTMMRKSDDQAYGPNSLGGFIKDWRSVCQAASDGMPIKDILTDYMTAYKVYDGYEDQGLFTGYYEPLLYGSLQKSARFHIPLYQRPETLIEVNLGDFREAFKGERIAGKIVKNRLVPFDDRTEIDQGALKDQGLELVWVDSAIDAFFLHIQGSGLVELEDGQTLRVGYAGQNGHIYYAIGRALIDRGEIARADISLQSIRAWLEKHPDQAAEVMQLNPSYVFFRALENTKGPLGAQGVALTPERSLAVDRRLIPYGSLIWLEAQHPTVPDQQIKSLFVAQDTGGAIRGAVRGDVFWGAGSEAALKAGQMKSKGRYWIFLPNTIDIEQAYQYTPSFIGRILSRF